MPRPFHIEKEQIVPKVESLIKRVGGTKVQLDDPATEYHFTPADGRHTSPHVAEVSDTFHLGLLLAIKEGYRLVVDLVKEAETAIVKAVTGTPATPATPAKTPAERMAAANAARLAKKAPINAATPTPPPAAAAVEKQPMTAPVAAADQASLSDGAIADQYTQAFGSAPPADMTRDMMIAALAALPPPA